jgi:hypothetical protein
VHASMAVPEAFRYIFWARGAKRPVMDWARILRLCHRDGTTNLAECGSLGENRIVKDQLKGRLMLSNGGQIFVPGQQLLIQPGSQGSRRGRNRLRQ